MCNQIQTNFIAIILLIGATVIGFGQDNSNYRIISSNLGSAGSTQVLSTSNGEYKISQSIGQASVIGTYQSNGYYLRQGYQQPLTQVSIKKTIDFELIAKVHPNPFRHQVNIAFSTELKNTISIFLIDINGKIIRDQTFPPSQDIQLELSDISVGTYILRVMSGGKRIDEKLIKI